MRTDHVIALASRVRELAHELILAQLEERGHPNLAPSHGAILVQLYEQGALPMGRLAQAINRKKNTVTVLVNKLEAEGYVQRRQSPDDSRVQLITLTEKGEGFREDFEAISALLLQRVWGDMEDAERAAVVRGLERMLDNLS